MIALLHPKTITVDGLSVRYAEGGQDGPDAILMSPWPESIYAFEPAWPHLAAAAHLVAIDPPGFGGSAYRQTLMNPKAMGHFILSVADALGLDNPHIVGPDIGTSSVLFAAAADQDRFRSAHFLMPKAEYRCTRRRAPCLTQLAQLRFRLLRPVGHAHFAIHRQRGGEVLLGLLAIAAAAMQFAEAQMAMGDKRTHVARLGERHGLAVVLFGVLGTARCGDVGGQGEGTGLNSSTPALARER
jgi:pimeloyl-ACP methyl ester carboxylesterase